jgi:peptidoglycan hydrolase CwlO-like protein
MAEKAFAEPHLDALDGLEDRIQKAVSLVSNLRKELASSQSEVERLQGEIASLREERTQVRSRLEKLLGHIDQLSL